MTHALLDIPDQSCCGWDAAVLEELFEQHRPLVASVCRRYLRGEAEVDDAVQETFVKLIRHAGKVGDHLPGWLCTVAASTSLDMVRRAATRRRHQAQMAQDALSSEGCDSQWLLLEMVRARLDDALRLVDEPTRKLIADRFFRGLQLRELAAQADVGLSTISRRIGQAVEELRAAFDELGVELPAQASLSDQLHELGDLTGILAASGDAGLRLATHRSEPNSAGDGSGAKPGSCPAVPRDSGGAPGARRIRVGALISHAGTQVEPSPGFRFSIERGVWELGLSQDPSIDRIGLIEPGTHEMPGIERTLRGFDLDCGVIDASDEEGLRTLDVIFLGFSLALPRRVLTAIRNAVRDGVGLYSEGASGLISPGMGDSVVRELLLAADDVLWWHHPVHCSTATEGKWVLAHPAFPGLQPGDVAPVIACGPCYKPRPDAQVLMIKEPVVQANTAPDNKRKLAEVEKPPMAHQPAVVVGTLGRGRVVNITFQYPLRSGSLGHHPHVRGDFLGNILHWLAEGPGRSGT